MTGPGPSRVPRLHIVTDDRVLSEDGFPARARRILEALGPAAALHVRAPAASGRFLHGRVRALDEAAGAAGAPLVVNDRLDVALAAGKRTRPGGHVGARGLPPRVARRLLGDERLLGVSVHSAEAAREAAAEGADFLFVGTIYATGSHPDRPGAGPERLREVGAALALHGAAGPRMVAIGGIRGERVGEVLAAGARGVAVIRAVWDDADPAAAARALLETLPPDGEGTGGDP